MVIISKSYLSISMNRAKRLNYIGNVSGFLDIKVQNTSTSDNNKELTEENRMDSVIMGCCGLEDNTDAMKDIVFSEACTEIMLSANELLTKEQKYILSEYYLKGRTQLSIAEELKTSSAYIFRVLKKSKGILKEYWNDKINYEVKDYLAL